MSRDHFEALPPPVNKYGTTDFTVGISCEKCHGPSGKHTEREKSKSLRRPQQS